MQSQAEPQTDVSRNNDSDAMKCTAPLLLSSSHSSERLGRTDRWGQEREDQAEQGKAREDPGAEGGAPLSSCILETQKPREFHAKQDIKPLPLRVVVG